MVPMSLTYGLLGRYLGHSFSPAIHRQLGAYDYQLIELPPEKVGPFLQSGQFQGLNVTIPYKKTVMAFCHHLSPAARRIGSVNTIVKQPDGTIRSLSPRQVADLLGHSTSEITELYYVKKDTSRLAGITAGFDL